MKCCGITKKRKRCKREKQKWYYPFCGDHFWQPIALIIGLGSAIIYLSDLAEAVGFEKPFVQTTSNNTNVPGQDSINTKSIVIYVHGLNGIQDYVLENEGEVLIDIGNDRRFEKIGKKGRTVFSGIPTTLEGKGIFISMKADKYESVEPEKRYTWTGQDIYYAVKLKKQHKEVRLNNQKPIVVYEESEGNSDDFPKTKGVVKDKSGKGIPNVIIRTQDGTKVTTNELGMFSLILAKPKKEYPSKIRLFYSKDTLQSSDLVQISENLTTLVRSKVTTWDCCKMGRELWP